MSKNYYIIPIFVPHEGCPHNCVFCNQNSITGSSNKVDAEFVNKTVKEYIKTIKLAKGDNAIIEISFFGGTFTAIPKEKQNQLLNVARKFKKSGDISHIRLSTRPDYIDKEILDNLKKYSVDIIELGVQSLDEEVLKMSGRGHSVEDVINASKLINDYDFVLGHQIMLGLPGDTFEKDIKTVKKSIRLSPKICRIYPALVVKNTPMEKMYQYGQYKPYSLSQAVYISKIVYGMFLNNSVNVIRIGLQPTKEINYNAEVVAGPFHPSFRELVEGSLYNDMIYDNIKAYSNDTITIYVSKKDISKVYANKKKYYKSMVSKLNDIKLNIKQNQNLARNNLIIKIGDLCKTASLRDYTSNKLSYIKK